MSFVRGRTVLRRYFRGGSLVFVQSGQVIGDDERGLLLWVPAGAAGMRRVLRDGRRARDVRLRDWLSAPSDLRPAPWRAPGVLKLMPVGTPWSVWWFWHLDGRFRNWYVNLEDPGVRWDDGDTAGVDTADRALDLIVNPDLTWRWKDEADFAERTGHALFWDASGALAIRADGERAVAGTSVAAFPFDGTWTDFRPDPRWTVPVLPRGWNRPRAGLDLASRCEPVPAVRD